MLLTLFCHVFKRYFKFFFHVFKRLNGLFIFVQRFLQLWLQ